MTIVDCGLLIFGLRPSTFGALSMFRSPYMVSVNFEFNSQVGMEFYDGNEYKGDSLDRIDLCRNRVLATSKGGYEFDIAFNIDKDAFAELREYLKILLRSDCYRQASRRAVAPRPRRPPQATPGHSPRKTPPGPRQRSR